MMSNDSIVTRARTGGSRESRSEEAARWFVTLKHAELSERLLRMWKEWEADPQNREAFDAIERLWRVAPRVPELPAATAEELADDHYNASVPVSSWRSTREVGSTATRARRFVSRRRSAFRVFGLAAAIAAMIIAIQSVPVLQPFIQNFRTAHVPERTVVVETGLGEHRQIVFEDGSRIHLGAQSSITASFTQRTRNVTLDRGEAHFKVARDPNRPFEVNAGGGTITAVGTAFNVQRREDANVVVTVTEGIVEVVPAATRTEQNGEAPTVHERPAAQRVTRGQEVTYDASGTISPVRVAEVDTSVAWRNGRFKYSNEPLKHVIEDVNRYSRRQLILDSPAVGEVLYSGTVFESDVDEWVAGLEKTFPQLQVVSTDARVVIRTRAAVTETTKP